MVRYMTWTPSAMVSTLQLPAHLKLKSRHEDQQVHDVQINEYKINLELKEAEAYVDKDRFDLLSTNQRTLMLEHSQNEDKKQKLSQWMEQHAAIEDKSSQRGGESSNTNALVKYDDSNDEDDSLLSSDDESDDEHDQELMRELQKLKEESQREADTQNEIQQAQQLQNALNANPLLQGASSSSATSGATSLKRKWNSSTIFNDQAKQEKRKKARFINDTLRNDFHRDFMNHIMK
mmetsp:Transcript_10377/g.38487  ORF Transcript_10377/g.38487 Transcript_10377/m.38487 type:complete len:234 (-) Transcript_10377:3302-4003(-)